MEATEQFLTSFLITPDEPKNEVSKDADYSSDKDAEIDELEGEDNDSIDESEGEDNDSF